MPAKTQTASTAPPTRLSAKPASPDSAQPWASATPATSQTAPTATKAKATAPAALTDSAQTQANANPALLTAQNARFPPRPAPAA